MEVALLMIVLAVAVAVSGPAALILALTLRGRMNQLEERLRSLPSLPQPRTPEKPFPVPPPAPVSPPTTPPQTPQPVMAAAPPSQPAAPPKTVALPPSVPAIPKAPHVGLEQKIGTTVALVAGVITVIVGVGFFLKYVYDHAWFGPTARVLLAAGGGAIALAVGEITRRRNYDIVAKGVTALGFGLLYAAVFSASRVYLLIEMPTAFVLAIVITAGAMAYAVGLNELFIAFLSLLGGYLSPFIISTGRNLPIPLFSYLFALAAGALGCAMFRRWRAINWITLVGTYLLYTGWFESFYTPAQQTLALVWLGVFGGLFLVMPLGYGLLKRIAARAEDVGLVVANSVVVFYYLWQILHVEHRQAQAFAVVAVGAAHLAMLAAVWIRCRLDRQLQAALGVLATAIITAAVPLYFASLNPTLLTWSIEAVVLTFVGIRYGNRWLKTMAVLVSAVAAAGLFYHLPLHSAGQSFRVVFNAPFGTWMAVTAAVLICHLLWRFCADSLNHEDRRVSEVFYAAAIALAAIGAAMEWYAHCRWNIQGDNWNAVYVQGGVVLLSTVVLLLLARPLPPTGEMVRTLGVLTAMVGVVIVLATREAAHTAAFVPVLNLPFAVAAIYVAAMTAGACWLRRAARGQDVWSMAPAAMAIAILLMVWVLLSQEVYLYWQYRNRYAGPVDNWRFTAQMMMSMVWAIYGAALMIGGVVFRARPVRYLALTLFAVLLAKIFLLDTVDLRTEYRIAGFLTTGLILVGVSFLYQYLKKKGFFETTHQHNAD